MNNGKVMHLELNITKQCNMRCSYCTEAGQYDALTAEKIIPIFLDFVDRLLESEYFISNYTSVIIGFWGGEPTLKSDLIIDIIEKYKKDSRVGFLLYTNGFKMPEKLAELIVSLRSVDIVSGQVKIFTQISYDGQPIHDLKRTSVAGKPTSEVVRNTILWAKYNRIPYSIKSTITMDMFKHMYDAYMDINDLVQRDDSPYFPTLDYFNDMPMDDKFLEHLNDMKINLKKIAAAIISKRNNNKKALPFKWFLDSKANCSAGSNFFSVDVDGRLFACHGCFYTEDKEDHLIGTLLDDFDIIEENSKKYTSCVSMEPEECKSCLATFCVRCNTVRYSASEKETYIERWKDYTNNPTLCTVYKEAGLIARAFQKLSLKN